MTCSIDSVLRMSAERVAGQHDQIGDLSRREQAERVHAEDERAVPGGRLERTARPNPAADEQLHLAVQGVAGDQHLVRGIGPGGDDAAGGDELAEEEILAGTGASEGSRSLPSSSPHA